MDQNKCISSDEIDLRLTHENWRIVIDALEFYENYRRQHLFDRFFDGEHPENYYRFTRIVEKIHAIKNSLIGQDMQRLAEMEEDK